MALVFIFMGPTLPWHNRFFYNADGEMLILPQQGRLLLRTELGILDVAPGELAVIPRGIKFRAELPDGTARGYICENYGQTFRLPELGSDRGQRFGKYARFSHAGSQPMRIAKVLSSDRKVPRQAVAAEIDHSAAGRGGRGTATTRRTSTTWRSSTASTQSASIIPIRPSSLC